MIEAETEENRKHKSKETGESGKLNKFHEKQQGMELIILEQPVPQEHLLRKIDRSIGFSFIRRLCAPLYSANLERPAIEPEVLFVGVSLRRPFAAAAGGREPL